MTIEQITKELKYGDYNTLGEMLGISATAAKMRFIRGDEEAKKGLETIIENRKELISSFKKEPVK